MSTVVWDPNQYLHYRDERIRPFLELLARVHCDDPKEVVDLGCGPGNATVLLNERWPEAHVTGVDNSEEMMTQAVPFACAGKLDFERGDIHSWSPRPGLDVLFSNAAFQWVPGHMDRFADFVAGLATGGWFAFQVPDMSGAPSHVALYELAHSPRWGEQLRALARPLTVQPPEVYVQHLHRLGCQVDAWQTTYQQILPGDTPILDWVRGSSMRPFLSVLSPEERIEFQNDYSDAIAGLYVRDEAGTIYPFHRTFVVAQKMV
jgi:trans-aconitate 2-methyltransferase